MPGMWVPTLGQYTPSAISSAASREIKLHPGPVALQCTNRVIAATLSDRTAKKTRRLDQNWCPKSECNQYG